MARRSYAILGTGALGGYYGGLLAQAGFETHFLLRSDFKHVREHGLTVDSIRGDFAIPADQINAYGGPADLPACDAAVVCLKTTQNDQLPELLASCVKPDGVVLVLQNGLHPEADAAAVVGDDRVLGGLCFLCSNKIGPGHIQHLDYGHIHLGVYAPDQADSPAAHHFHSIVDDFNAAGIETIGVDDLRLSRWKKLVWNIPYNGLSVMLNQTTDVMMADPGTRRRIEAIMREVQAAALAVDGKVIEDAFIQKMLDYTAKMEPYKTSMMLDREAGRVLEVESILGDPLRAIQAKNVEAHFIAELCAGLRLISYSNMTEDEKAADFAKRSPWTRRLLFITTFGSMAIWLTLGLGVSGHLKGQNQTVWSLVVLVAAFGLVWLPPVIFAVGLIGYFRLNKWLRNGYKRVRWQEIQSVNAVVDDDLGPYLEIEYADDIDDFYFDEPGFRRIARLLESRFPEIPKGWKEQAIKAPLPYKNRLV